eukprot:TRINITY_DN5471_c0_g1_i3.p1 TRINITY_DN5471_c0_g1~~TRINITY_DN5471_c0_g1_i3.p1  ORF type:complete len:533 (-),score=93.31 TRINITY_DN5471_c0_g1_i3:363-1961(-)
MPSAMRPFFKTFMERDDSDTEEEEEWDEAARVEEDREATSQFPLHALCPECSRPLKRIASIPYKAMCLGCARQHECGRCGEDIGAGEMNFKCRRCVGVRICRKCGPNVYIERSYDFYDASAKSVEIKEIPNSVVHERTRSVTLQTFQAPADVMALAKGITERALQLGKTVAAAENIRDHDWLDGSTLPFLLGMGSGGALENRTPQEMEEGAKRVIGLVTAAMGLFESQPVLTHATVPCKVFGDIHGQLRDVLLYFTVFGAPGKAGGPEFVFNGDFVDRGAHQIEVVVVLFAFKLLHPDRVWLNRGNHEDRNMNKKYNFDEDVFRKLPGHGDKVFKVVADAFDMLPLACLIDRRVLCVHGGVGQGKWSIKDLDNVQRPLSHADLQQPENNWLWNMLWSDPIEDDEGLNTFGVHSSGRKCSTLTVRFGWSVTQAFCAINGLDLVIRSHQSKRGGLGFDVMHNNMLIRVFSARDYERNHNDGSILHLNYTEPPDDSDGSDDEDEEVAEALVRKPCEYGLLTVRPQVLGSTCKTFE